MNNKAEIIAWNLKRNSLHFDPILEAKMLTEEAHEFYTAPNLVERIREYCDFLFVSIGTEAKYYAKQCADHRELAYAHAHFQELWEWIRDAQEAMRDTLFKEIWYYLGITSYVSDFIQDCLKAVVDANNAKGTEKDENGKVVKGKNYVAPSEAIGKLLEELKCESR